MIPDREAYSMREWEWDDDEYEEYMGWIEVTVEDAEFILTQAMKDDHLEWEAERWEEYYRSVGVWGI